MKKKLAIITLHLNYGGVELASINLANMLKDVYDVTIVNMYDSDLVYDIEQEVKIEQLSKLKPNKRKFIDNLKHLRFMSAFKEGIRAINILKLRKNLVKKHLLEENYDIIISSRDFYTKLLNELNIKSIKIAIEHKHHNNNKKYINFIKKNTNNIDALVLVSKELTCFYEKICECICKYIPNAIKNIPKQDEVNIDKKENIILAVGRLSKEKGFLDLIDVFEQINKVLPDYKLVLAGDGDQRKKIKQKISAKKLENNVQLTGFLSKNDLNKIYKKAKIYLMTSYEESFGLVVGEAQSYKIPVIAFDTATGAVELLNGTGVIIPNRDIDKMANKAIDLINNPDKYKKISKDSYSNSLKYSFKNVKSIWISFLKQMERKKNGDKYEKKE